MLFVDFDKIIEDRTGGNKKLKQSEYLDNGVLPIVDQGQGLIAGYTNDVTAKATVKLPCIVFGDHTRIFKFIDFPFVLGADGVKVLEPDTKLDSLYAYYYLGQVKLSGKEGYNRNFKYLKEVKIPLPELKTQQKIAGILAQADSARQKRKQANLLTEQFLQSAFLEMFGDPNSNPKNWAIGTIQDVVEYSEYGTSNKSNQDKVGYPVLGMANITYNGQIDLSKLSYVELTDDEFQKLRLKKGDILFNRTNSTELVGKTAYWNGDIDAVIASYLVKLRLNESYNPICFSFLLNTDHFKKMFMRRCKKAVGQSNVSPTLLKEFPIYIPPLPLQQKFAALVEQTERLRAKQRESERELENLFQSLMQKYFG